MAIISKDMYSADQGSNSVILERLELIERMFAELDNSLERTNLEIMMQQMRLETATKELTKGVRIPDREKSWRERLVFRNPDVVSDTVWRGNVENCYRYISENIEKHVTPRSYLGSTCDPERRFKEHMKKSPHLPLSMNILYHTTSVQKAADMESRLLSRFKITRNASLHSHGLLWGKPSYFVYMLVEKGLKRCRL